MIARIKLIMQYLNSSNEQKIFIADYLAGKRFMSRYHAGQKKEVVKEKKPRKHSTGLSGVFFA